MMNTSYCKSSSHWRVTYGEEIERNQTSSVELNKNLWSKENINLTYLYQLLEHGPVVF